MKGRGVDSFVQNDSPISPIQLKRKEVELIEDEDDGTNNIFTHMSKRMKVSSCNPAMFGYKKMTVYLFVMNF